MSKTTVIITTINVPTFIDGICTNIQEYKHSGVNILVIGDKKTPAEVVPYCQKAEKKYGIEVEYLSPEDQLKVLAEYPDLLALFPFNTPDRTILGGMLSYIRGSERIIAVDDDNYTTSHDFIGFHGVVGTKKKLNLFSNDLGWFNVHSTLIEQDNVPFYPRGYPWKQRKPEASRKTVVEKTVRVVVNQGLVLGDPDIDAISRLFWPITAVGMSPDIDSQFGLLPGTWSPFNYQNTALARELIPCYYRPLSTQRNADIWTAYVFNRLAQHFGDVLTFGQPLVKQVRNVHDLWDDLDIELINNRATDHFVAILRKVDLSRKSYFEALRELLAKSQTELQKVDAIPPAERDMIRKFFVEYDKWCKVVDPIVQSQTRAAR